MEQILLEKFLYSPTFQKNINITAVIFLVNEETKGLNFIFYLSRLNFLKLFYIYLTFVKFSFLVSGYFCFGGFWCCLLVPMLP